MKKILLICMTLAIALPVLADLDGDGYYRVQNAYTKRYCYLTDNKGYIDKGSTSADVAALKLFKGQERVISDPSTVFYISKAPTGTYKYDIAGQGTSIHSFLDLYMDILSIGKYDGRTCYFLYGSTSGMSKYLGDVRSDMNNVNGLASVDAKEDDRKWYLDPIDAETDQYFGISPSIQVQNKYYYPLYADFPFSAWSAGLKFYTITKLDYRGVAVLKEITGTVPASTPVIVECSSPNVYDNKFNVGGKADAAVAAGNLLKGVYFDNDSRSHYNRTAYDKQTMRVLGVANGRLAFVESNLDFLPANQAYLKLTDSAQYSTAYFTVMTEDEYLGGVGAIGEIEEDLEVDVYTMDGTLVKNGILKSEVSSLGTGLYILRSGSSSEKMIVR